MSSSQPVLADAGKTTLTYRPIALEHRRVLTPYLDYYSGNEGSECTFSNLYIWGEAEHIEWCTEAGNLFLHVRERGENPCLLMVFVPPGALGHALDIAIADMARRGERFQMRGLPDWYARMMEASAPGRFVFEREPHHDDYVYRAEDLIGLKGQKLHGKRNHINKFRSLYEGRYAYERFTPGHIEACLALHRRWLESQADARSAGLREEFRSVCRALEGAQALGLIGGVIRLDEEVAAFTLGEQITRDMALIHVEKADPGIPGLFSMINREFAGRELAALTWINREEDMGDEGLRRAKRSYQPARMIEKYGATLA